MRGQYKHQPIVATDWPPRVGRDFFGRLALLEKQNSKVQKQDSITGKDSAWYQLRGQVDTIVKMTKDKEISVEDILKPKDSSVSLRVVIDGPPGIGKTTLCRKLLNMWSEGKLHQQYDLVLYCPLRNSKIATATTLTDLFVYKSPKLPKVVKWFSDGEGKGLLIIFDGWDELSTEHRKSSFAASIICREQLDQCAVIVTSRSYASSSLLELTTNSSHVQVIGFSANEIATVIIQTLQEDQKLAQEHIAENKDEDGDCEGYFTTIQSNKGSQLINDLKVRGDVRSLCYIPLVCSMVILVYCKEGHLPTTLTQLYENFILQTIRRHVKRHDINPRTLGSLSLLPSQLADAFQEMCQIAYTNLANTRMTFSFYELHQLSLSEAVKEDYLGLMTAFTEYDEEKYQFLHLSIQEFLAAWWIAKHEEKAEEVFKTHFDDDHFRMCLRFVAGLTHLEHESYQQYLNKQQLDLQCKRELLFGFNDYRVSSFHRNYDITTKHAHHTSLDDFDFDKFSFLLQLLYESQNATLCAVLAQSINNQSLCVGEASSRSLFNWLCLSYFINNSNTTWKEIDLNAPYFDGKEMLSVFNTGLTNSSAQTQCERLRLEFDESSDVSMKQLLQTSLLHNIQECYCKLRDRQCISGLVLLQFFKLPKIKVLHLIIKSRITDIPVVGGTHSDMCNELQKSIEQNSTLQEMKIFYRDADQLIANIVTFIMREVTGNKTLTSLSLTADAMLNKDCPTIPDGVIEQLLKDNKTLQALSLDIPGELIPSSLNIVEVNMPLTALEIADFRASRSKLTKPLLTHISGLKCLILHEEYLLPYLIFHSHPSLHTLRLPLDSVVEAIELFTILETNTTLKALKAKISLDDDIDTTTLLGVALENMLAINKTLIYLEIHVENNHYHWMYTIILLPYLTRGIERNTTLQLLHIRISLPNNEAIRTLFDIISQKKNLTEFKVTFSLDKSHSGSRSIDEESERMTDLFYKEVLPAVTNMLQSHTTIRFLKFKLECYLSEKELLQNEIEIIQHFFETILVHPKLEYFKIKGASEKLCDQKESLINKHRQKQPHKPLPIINV